MKRSADWHKADMGWCTAKCPLMTQSGHQSCFRRPHGNMLWNSCQNFGLKSQDRAGAVVV